MRRLPNLVGITAVVSAVALACGNTGAEVPPTTEETVAGATATVEAGRPCAPEVSEGLDASSSLHLLPGAPEPTYLSDPPTSGPHLSGPAPSGALGAPIDRPTQVQVLEQGGVLIQYRDLDPGSVATLATLAGDDVVVAPNPGLASPVVATAWLTKLECEALDVDTLRRFIAEHRGEDPEHG